MQNVVPVSQVFAQTLETAYSAQAENLDFRDPKSVETINAWVANHTNDRIQKILQSVDPSTVAVLTNAIAFKGNWSLPFDPKMTQPHDFKNAIGNLRKVSMMKHSGEYSYASQWLGDISGDFGLCPDRAALQINGTVVGSRRGGLTCGCHR